MKEIVSMYVGQAGVQTGSSLWELFCAEHHISYDGLFVDDKTEYECLDTLFHQVSATTWVPRSLFVDLEPTVVDEIRKGMFRSLFHPDRLISGPEDAANNFSRGFFTVGKLLLAKINEQSRHLFEQCDMVQGILIIRSLGGGTGAGLTSAMFEGLSDYPKTPKIEIPIYPSPTLSTSMVEPYNCLLGEHFCMEDIDVGLLLDNEAMFEISAKFLSLNYPTYNTINRMIAQVVSSVTASVRFVNVLNCDLSVLQTNMVPYPRIHFPLCNFAPLMSEERASHQDLSVQDLTRLVFDRSNQMMKVDHFYGKFMSCALFFRGNICPHHVYMALSEIKRDHSIEFVDWCPTGFKVGINAVSPVIIPDSKFARTKENVAMLTNTSAIGQAWQRLTHRFYLLYSKRSFVHWFVGEGMEECEFTEALYNISALVKDYEEAGENTSNITNEATKKQNPPPTIETKKTETKESETKEDDNDQSTVGTTERSASNSKSPFIWQDLSNSDYRQIIQPEMNYKLLSGLTANSQNERLEPTTSNEHNSSTMRNLLSLNLDEKLNHIHSLVDQKGQQIIHWDTNVDHYKSVPEIHKVADINSNSSFIDNRPSSLHDENRVLFNNLEQKKSLLKLKHCDSCDIVGDNLDQFSPTNSESTLKENHEIFELKNKSNKSDETIILNGNSFHTNPLNCLDMKDLVSNSDEIFEKPDESFQKSNNSLFYDEKISSKSVFGTSLESIYNLIESPDSFKDNLSNDYKLLKITSVGEPHIFPSKTMNCGLQTAPSLHESKIKHLSMNANLTFPIDTDTVAESLALRRSLNPSEKLSMNSLLYSTVTEVEEPVKLECKRLASSPVVIEDRTLENKSPSVEVVQNLLKQPKDCKFHKTKFTLQLKSKPTSIKPSLVTAKNSSTNYGSLKLKKSSTSQIPHDQRKSKHISNSSDFLEKHFGNSMKFVGTKSSKSPLRNCQSAEDIKMSKDENYSLIKHLQDNQNCQSSSNTLTNKVQLFLDNESLSTEYNNNDIGPKSLINKLQPIHISSQKLRKCKTNDFCLDQASNSQRSKKLRKCFSKKLPILKSQSSKLVVSSVPTFKLSNTKFDHHNMTDANDYGIYSSNEIIRHASTSNFNQVNFNQQSKACMEFSSDSNVLRSIDSKNTKTERHQEVHQENTNNDSFISHENEDSKSFISYMQLYSSFNSKLHSVSSTITHKPTYDRSLISYISKEPEFETKCLPIHSEKTADSYQLFSNNNKIKRKFEKHFQHSNEKS